jgi:ATP synthase protein I
MNQNEHSDEARAQISGEDTADLDERIRRARAKLDPQGDSGSAGASETAGWAGMAFRMGIEVFAALAVGCGMGLLLDRWLGTGPWLLILFFFLGSGAGVMNVYRASRGMGYSVGYGPPPGNGPGEGRN